MSKQYAHLHTMAKTSVKFQNDWPKTVGVLTSQLLTDKRTNGRVTARLYRTCVLTQVRQKRKLPPPACQVRFWLPSVVCPPTLQEVQACTTDHDLCLSFTLSPFSSIASFQVELPDKFLERFSNDNKVIGIEVLPGDPRAELTWQGFKHNDEEQRAEYQALVNTDLHFKLHCTPHQHGYGSVHWHTSLGPVA